MPTPTAATDTGPAPAPDASCSQCGASDCHLRSRPPCAACGRPHAQANVSTAAAEIACCDRACGELLIGLADVTR